jgi:formylglycine-generating enzyme required for sulfatase activity
VAAPASAAAVGYGAGKADKHAPDAGAKAAPVPLETSAAVDPAPGACPDGMVRVPGGTFQMGSAPGDGYEDERPPHAETVATLCLDRTEVTVAAYRACVETKACTEPDKGERCNWGAAGRDEHPINCVDWSQAKTFCGAAGKRLPTEREWEYAARGPEGRTYPWGESTPSNQLCWNGEGSDLGRGKRQSTCKVGSYPAGNSPLGLQDLAGNVWEWVEDLYCPYTRRDCAGTARVNRGGAWSYGYASDMRAANRHRYAPADRSYGVGFRCAWAK